MAIRLRFVTDSDLVSRIIRGGEMGFWASHVEAVAPGQLTPALAGETPALPTIPAGSYVGAHMEGGFQALPPDYDKGEWTQQLFVDVPATPKQEAAFWASAASKLGCPYDIAAIGNMAEGALKGSDPTLPLDNSYICSAAMVDCLIAAGIVKSAPAGIRLTTPRDVLCMCAKNVAIGEPEIPTAQQTSK